MFGSDLSLVKTATGAAPYISGSIVTYTLTWANSGPNDTTGIVTDIWPTAITFMSADNGGTFDGTSVTWT